MNDHSIDSNVEEADNIESTRRFTPAKITTVPYDQLAIGATEISDMLELEIYRTLMPRALPADRSFVESADAISNYLQLRVQTIVTLGESTKAHGSMEGNSRKYVNSAKKSHYALTPLFRNGAVPRSWGDFADCGKFVSYVIRNSPGGDPNFPSSFVETQRDYVVRHSEKYDIFPNTWSNAQPGDILFGGSCNLSRNDPDPDHDGILGECSGRMTYYGHIQIYTGENNAFPGKIVVEASYGVKHPENMRGPMANGKYNKMNIIARLKATAPVSVK